MTMTEQRGYTPRPITATQAESRVQDVRDLARSNDYSEASLERAQLYLDVLWTIAHAPTMADKRELKRLAALALEAFEIPIVRQNDIHQSQSG